MTNKISINLRDDSVDNTSSRMQESNILSPKGDLSLLQFENTLVVPEQALGSGRKRLTTPNLKKSRNLDEIV